MKYRIFFFNKEKFIISSPRDKEKRGFSIFEETKYYPCMMEINGIYSSIPSSNKYNYKKKRNMLPDRYEDK